MNFAIEVLRKEQNCDLSNHSLSHDYVYGGVISHRHKSHNYKKSSCAARDQRKVQGDQLKFGYSEKATKFEKIFHSKFDATQ